jgi:hypothetical protein
VGLNTNNLCSEALHCAKSTLEKLENGVTIVGSSEKFWGLAAILDEQLGANPVQLRRGKIGTLLLHSSWKESQKPHFPFPSCK